jgi:hypothetical protein
MILRNMILSRLKFASNYLCPSITIDSLPNPIVISLLEKLNIPSNLHLNCQHLLLQKNI